MSQNLTRANGRPGIGATGLGLHRAIEILLAHRRGAAIQDIDPALDREQVRAVADLAAYYFGERARTRLPSARGRPFSYPVANPP